MRQVWDVAHILTEEERNHTCWQENLEKRECLEDLSTDEGVRK